MVNPTEGSGGGRASTVDVGVVEGRYLPLALRLLDPSNGDRATPLSFITPVNELPIATNILHTGTPLGHEVSLGARSGIDCPL